MKVRVKVRVKVRAAPPLPFLPLVQIVAVTMKLIDID